MLRLQTSITNQHRRAMKNDWYWLVMVWQPQSTNLLPHWTLQCISTNYHHRSSHNHCIIYTTSIAHKYCRNTMSAGRSGSTYESIALQVCKRKEDSTEPTPAIEPLMGGAVRSFNRLLDGNTGFKEIPALQHKQVISREWERPGFTVWYVCETWTV